MDQDRLKTIVAALLNDAGRTPEEAELAKKKAAQLMLQAGVTQEELLAEDADMLLEMIDIGRREWLVSKYVATRVARLSGCQTYYEKMYTSQGRRSDRKKVHFAGYRPDVENAQWLFNHIIEASKRAVKASGLKENREKEDMLTTFAVTVAMRLNDIADAMDTAREEEGVPVGNDLVLVRDAKIDDFLKDQGVQLATAHNRPRGEVGLNAAEAGRKAGSEVSLGRPIEGNGPLALPSK